jgi:nucleoid-associated protein YgaU
MGRLEKIVVLTVLFLVAVILGVSLNQGGDTVDPLPAGLQAKGETSEPAQLEEQAGVPPTALSAQIGSQIAGSAAAPQSGDAAAKPEITLAPSPAAGQESAPAAKADPLAAGSLVTSEGLVESLDPEVMIYTWAEGDTFLALAERYFGSRLEVARLRRANEGRAEGELRPGDRIFVPRHAPAAGETLAKDTSAAGQWEGGVYRVENGDMLGKIAKKVYGSASKWRVIYDANRDVLASPDDLEVGMALRIPRVE